MKFLLGRARSGIYRLLKRESEAFEREVRRVNDAVALALGGGRGEMGGRGEAGDGGPAGDDDEAAGSSSDADEGSEGGGGSSGADGSSDEAEDSDEEAQRRPNETWEDHLARETERDERFAPLQAAAARAKAAKSGQ